MKDKEYIRLPKQKILPDKRSELRKLNDDDWKNLIFHHLLRFYKEADFGKIKIRIQDEKKKERSYIETVVKKEIVKWLRNDQCFDTHEFKVDREPSSDGVLEGLYDLKFQHSQWKNKYFPFECKNLNRTAASLNEYVFNKAKEDGGVYRYITGKYAPELDFGGMLGFILEGDESEIISKIIEKISSAFHSKKIGKLEGKGIREKAIEGNPNTFESVHLRECKAGQPFILHHIIFDMD